MRTIVVIASLSAVLFANNIGSFFDSMKKQQEQYQDKNISNNTKSSLVEKFNIPSESNLSSEHNTTINSLKRNSTDAIDKAVPWISKNMTNGVKQEQLQPVVDSMLKKTVKEEKVDTIFYLFSTSQTEYSLYNFISNAVKLEAINKNIKYYGVVQGMLEEKDLERLYKPFQSKENLGEKTIIKMHPLMYQDLGLKRVPAYLFSKCSTGEFKYKNCENKYLIRGDISLQKALEIVSAEDSSYLSYLHLLEKGEY